MSQLARSKASLIITSFELRPENISELLGREGSTMYSRGDTRMIGEPPREIKRKHGHWSLAATECEPEDINGQVIEIFGMLSGDINVWKQIAIDHRLILYCGMFMERSNEAVNLSTDTLNELNKREVELFFDIYGNH